MCEATDTHPVVTLNNKETAQDMGDLVEYAYGDANTTTWGAGVCITDDLILLIKQTCIVGVFQNTVTIKRIPMLYTTVVQGET